MSEILSILVFIGIVLGILKLLQNVFMPNLFSPKMYCSNCGSQGKAKKIVPGSVLIELILWICFIIPGLIYSIWRISSKRYVCSACGNSQIIPLDSPKAKEALANSQQRT